MINKFYAYKNVILQARNYLLKKTKRHLSIYRREFFIKIDDKVTVLTALKAFVNLNENNIVVTEDSKGNPIIGMNMRNGYMKFEPSYLTYHSSLYEDIIVMIRNKLIDRNQNYINRIKSDGEWDSSKFSFDNVNRMTVAEAMNVFHDMKIVKDFRKAYEDVLNDRTLRMYIKNNQFTISWKDKSILPILWFNFKKDDMMIGEETSNLTIRTRHFSIEDFVMTGMLLRNGYSVIPRALAGFCSIECDSKYFGEE